MTRWRRWSLRARLGLAVACLAGLALVVANAAGLILLRSYLTDKVDDQLDRVSASFATKPDRPLPSLPSGQPPSGRTPTDMYRYVYDQAGTLVQQPVQDANAGLSPPKLPEYAQLARSAGTGPYTVESVDGDLGWRIIVVTSREGELGVFGVALDEVDVAVDSLLIIDATVMAVVLILVGLMAAGVVRIGLAPLTRMEAIAAEIARGDLSRRVDDADPHTEPGRLGIALNTMLARIESEVAARIASENQLRQFLADASHELRTPLTSIRGFAELYRRGGAPPGPALDETMGRIESEAARMGLLVEDLLLLARLDLQRPLEVRPVDLLAIAADTIRDAHARAPERQIRLASLYDDFEPVTVVGDEHRLRQVATNLVANALQHTPPTASITVRVGRVRPPAQRTGAAAPWAPGVALLEVADDGPGIPAEHAGRVFERLYRVDRSRSRTQGGAGLGLSIVAAIVSRHGGTVLLDTAEGRGCVFRVVLPARL